MVTSVRLRAVAVLAVGLGLVLGLAGCGEWSPFAEPTTTAGPTESAEPTQSVTPTPVVTATPTPTTNSTPLGPLSGTWDGTWINTAPVVGTGTFTLSWGQQGSHVVGAITIDGSDCVTAGNVDGTALGTRLRFGAVEGADTIEYEGTIVDADTLQGTYRSTDCGNAEGTWRATRRKP